MNAFAVSWRFAIRWVKFPWRIYHGLPKYLASAEKILAELSGAEIGKWIETERIRRFVAIRDSLH